MEAEALKRIEELVRDAAGVNTLHTKTDAIILDGKVVSLEHLQEGRARFRGRFSTSVLAEFCAYVGHYGQAQLFIDPEKTQALAYLNLGDAEDPGHGDWVASLGLKPTAAYAAATAADGARYAQRDLADWIEDWAANLTAWKGEEALTLATAVARIRNITIAAKKDVTSADRDFGATRSALEEIEAKADGGMPSHLKLRCAPYLGFAERDITLRLSVITGDKPQLALRMVGREALQEQLLIEFKCLLLEQLGEKVARAVIGTFQP